MTQRTYNLAECMRQPDFVQLAARSVAAVGPDSWTISDTKQRAGISRGRTR